MVKVVKPSLSVLLAGFDNNVVTRYCAIQSGLAEYVQFCPDLIYSDSPVTDIIVRAFSHYRQDLIERLRELDEPRRKNAIDGMKVTVNRYVDIDFFGVSEQQESFWD